MGRETTNQALDAEFSNVIIRASAGTGKTFALSNRYLKLLASGAECQSILATTFTKKGAGEILDRIVGRLSAAALDADSAEKLSSELGWKLSQKRAADVLHDLLRNLHRLEISTLDSFFNRIAKLFSLELGLPPTWEIVEEQQIERLRDQAIQAVLQDDSVISLLHMLSKGEATRRVATMIQETIKNIYTEFRESGPAPWDQIPITGNFLPDDQLEAMLDKITNLEFPKVQLRNHWVEVATHARNGDWIEFASTTSFQNMLDGKLKFGSSKFTPEMVEIYQTMLPHCVAFAEQRLIQQNHSTRDLLMAFGSLLDEAKNATGELRFDDVTERLEQFISKLSTEQFSFRLDHQIQHLLLDEFQDTSLVQWNVIRPFARNVTQSKEAARSLFCVGDMKQAIYGWRGGVAEIFDLVDTELVNLDETQILTKSYRSAPEVIDLVNQVFLNVSQYHCDDELIESAIHQWSTWFSEHSTDRTALAGYVSIEMAAECGDEVAKFGSTKDSARNENVVQATVERIQSLTQTMPSDKSIGVIVRTNDEVGQLIFKLQQAGIPASEEGGNLLTDSAAVELILSALTLADHPGDSLARFHLSHSPLGEMFGLQPEWDSNQMENAETAHDGAAQLRQRLVSEGYGPVVESLARRLTDRCTQRELGRLQQLVQIAYSNSGSRERWQLRPLNFVEFVRNDAKVSDQSSAQVRVMTIHKAKGLEFDVVVLPIKVTGAGWAGMTPQVVVGRPRPTDPISIATRYAGEKIRKLLPKKFQRLFEEDRKTKVREAMCVLYVALTRAAHATHVILSHGAKVTHKSPAGILLATVCPDAPREAGLMYEKGNRNWYLDSAAVVNGQPSDRSAADGTTTPSIDRFYLPDSAQPKHDSVSKEIRSGRGMPRTSPSQLEGNGVVRLDQIFQTTKTETAMARGSQLHACFELVRWLEESVPTQPQLVAHLQRIDPSSTVDSKIVDTFYRCLENPHVRDLLSRHSYQEKFLIQFPAINSLMLEANRLVVETERPFAVQLESGILNGVIDRLVWIYEGDTLTAADVIDLKTDILDNSQLQARVEFYRPQLTSYRTAVAKFSGLPVEKIATRLLFVQSGQLVNLDLVETSLAPEQAKQLPKPTRKKPVPVKSPKQVSNSTPSKRKKSSAAEQQQTLWPED